MNTLPLVSVCRGVSAAGMIAALLLSGCATQPTAGSSKASEERYVTHDAPVGSHMKRRVKSTNAKPQDSVAPTDKAVVTEHTNTTVQPMLGGEMEKAVAGQGR